MSLKSPGSALAPTVSEASLVAADPDDFASLLSTLTGIDCAPSLPVARRIQALFDDLGPSPEIARAAALGAFYGCLNAKMFLNSAVLGDLYREAAARGVTFNYHAKKAISWAIDSSDLGGFVEALDRYCPDEATRAALIGMFAGATYEESRDALLAETAKPSKLRKALQREVRQDVLDAAAGCLVWSLWPHRSLRRHFESFGDDLSLTDDYLEGLRARSPELFERNRSLVVRSVGLGSNEEYEALRDELTGWLASEYETIDNYGHLAVIIEPHADSISSCWELAADLTLFAERFDQYALDRGYFQWKQVQEETLAHIPDLTPEAGQFHVAYEGFTYRDLFVLHDGCDVVRLLLLFQKNRRDETLIPCPACRTSEVRGNSYPSFGVKSWECRNPLCPERSIYNRGKRYQFKGLLNQEAIENPANLIPVKSVRRWRRDVLRFESDADILDMLVRHYTMEGDVVILIDAQHPSDSLGRLVKAEEPCSGDLESDFWASPFFDRFLTTKSPAGAPRGSPRPEVDQWAVVEGDSGEVLKGFAANCIDRAITSPPYYNAREYSQWPNIYCYLRDMATINAQVYRVLKPGAIYAFNIFDYFDNERTITFSAMGKKRLSLSSLFVDLFRRIGFEVAGNLVWDKGDVEGKRSFNRGNYTPFYQSPLNCWEHVLLFRKPGTRSRPADESLEGDRVLTIQPVVKMIRGENRHGHTAPYPEALAGALMAGLPSGALVLDPFGGSGSTARAGIDLGVKTLIIEKDADFAALAQRMIKDHERAAGLVQPQLF